MDTGGLRTAGPVITDQASMAGPNENLTKTRETTEVSSASNEIFELEAAALTILDLNRAELTQSSAEQLIKLLASTPIETIQKNAKLLETYGILPPVEIGGMTGGMLGFPTQGPNPRLPSQRLAAQQFNFGRTPVDLSFLPPPPPRPAWSTTRPSWWNSGLTFGAPAVADSTPAKELEEVLKSPRSSRVSKPSTIMEQVRAEEAARAEAVNRKRIAQEEARLKKIEDAKQAAANTGVSVSEIAATYDELSPILKSLDICSTKSAGKFMNALFPEKAVSKWREMGLQCRQIYEHGSVPAQCNNTIQEVNRQTDVCYVCGLNFFQGKDDPRLDEYEIEDCDQVEPTCEHILPIIQAIFFLDLYRPSDKGKLTEEQLSVLKKEYAWSHRCCNYTKGDTSYLKTVIDGSTRIPTWQFNEDDTYKYLKDISNDSDRRGLNIIRDMIGRSAFKKQTWRAARFDRIRIERVNPILDYIASKGMGGTIIIMGFQNCLDSSKINDKFHQVLNQMKGSESGKVREAPGKARRLKG